MCVSEFSEQLLDGPQHLAKAQRPATCPLHYPCTPKVDASLSHYAFNKLLLTVQIPLPFMHLSQLPLKPLLFPVRTHDCPLVRLNFLAHVLGCFRHLVHFVLHSVPLSSKIAPLLEEFISHLSAARCTF